jgi:metal-dependent amidase/aminoacylase/carboxypeptidase family protein
MSTGNERMDAVSERIEEAKQAADRVEEAEDLGLRHRESGASDDHATFEPSGDDGHAGRNPSEGRDAAAPGEVVDRVADNTP